MSRKKRRSKKRGEGEIKESICMAEKKEHTYINRVLHLAYNNYLIARLQ